MREVVELWRAGKLARPVEAVCSFDDAVDIFQRVAQRQIRGRAVVTAP